mmetsp:Transcript_103327/g.236749  ORF Transcript_103327/g.236749 Transcript_103327/m.236749 type:complete len:103 (+) Transcript_103327:143-451(+)
MPCKTRCTQTSARTAAYPALLSNSAAFPNRRARLLRFLVRLALFLDSNSPGEVAQVGIVVIVAGIFVLTGVRGGSVVRLLFIRGLLLRSMRHIDLPPREHRH